MCVGGGSFHLSPTHSRGGDEGVEGRISASGVYRLGAHVQRAGISWFRNESGVLGLGVLKEGLEGTEEGTKL